MGAFSENPDTWTFSAAILFVFLGDTPRSWQVRLWKAYIARLQWKVSTSFFFLFVWLLIAFGGLVYFNPGYQHLISSSSMQPYSGSSTYEYLLHL